MVGFLIELIIVIWLGSLALGMFGVDTEKFVESINQTIETSQTPKQQMEKKDEFIREEL